MLKTVKRFNLQIPGELVEEVGKIATRQGRSVAEMFRRYIKLGLLTEKEKFYILRDDEYVEVDMEN